MDDLNAVLRDAFDAHRAGDLKAAEAGYLTYLDHDRMNPAVWSNLAIIRRKAGQMPAAAAMQLRAQAISGGDAPVPQNLLNALLSANRVTDALRIDIADPRGRAMADDFDDAWRARALKALGRPRAALRHYERLVASGKANGENMADRAIEMLATHRYREGFAAYETRWALDALTRPSYPFPEWQGEPLEGRHLVLAGEQGLGDMIWLARFLPMLKAQGAARMTAVLRAPLVPLFESFGMFDTVHVREKTPKLVADHWLSAFDLPRHFWPENDVSPPPMAPKISHESRARIAPHLTSSSTLFKIGIVWAGSSTSSMAQRKVVNLRDLLKLSEVPGVQLFSLYKGEEAPVLKHAGLEGLIVDLGSRDRHLMDTAAAIEALDLVITVDTAVAHLAGSMGKPVWMLTPEPAFWYWNGVGEVTPHYPSMRVIRQSRPGDWDSAIDRIWHDLMRMRG